MIATATPKRQFGDTTAPESAFRISFPGQFKVGQKADNKTPIELFARSSEPVKHWYWGDIYHDFSGMTHKGSVPIDYCHDDSEIIGVVNEFTVKPDGLYLSGHLVSVKEGDRVDQLVTLSAADVPYESSIDFRGNCQYEEIQRGFTAHVNGRQVEGPALIVRKWPLRGVAVCPHGMDPNTSSQFSADAKLIDIQLLNSEGTMSGTTATTTDTKAVATQQTEANKAAQTPVVPAQQTETPAAAKPAEDGLQQYRELLKKYTDKFGVELGTQYFTEGKNWEQSLEAFSDHLGKQLTAKTTENQQLSERLASVHTGEEVPASLSQDPGEKTPDGQAQPSGQFAHLGKLGAFASSLKLPG